MRLYVEKSTGLVRNGPGGGAVERVEFKTRDTPRVEVVFLDGLAAVELDAGNGEAGRLGMKKADALQGAYLVEGAAWTKEGTGADTVYVFEPSLNTVGLLAEFATDTAYVDLVLEVEWTVGAVVSSTVRPVTARVWQDVAQGGEGTPLEAPEPEAWLAARAMRYHPELTGLTGGGATKLDGLATADDALQVGYIAVLESLGLATPYVLTDSDEAEDGTVYVRADDYATGTNERVWQWMGWWTAAVYSAVYGQFSEKFDFGQPLVPDDPVDLRHTRGVVESHGVRTLADAASIAWSAGSFAVVTLGGNRTLGKPAHAVSGAARLRLQITQDGTGNRTLAYAAGITFAGGVAPVLSTAGGAVDVLELVTFDSGATWRARLEKGFG